MEIIVTVLGSGSSFGTPGIGCECAVCRSSDPRDMRLRTSCLVSVGGKNYLIDPSPDTRYNLLRYEISTIDAVLLTHYHDDHTAGIFELRPFYVRNGRKPMPLYCSPFTMKYIEPRYDYLFERFDVTLLKDKMGDMGEFQYFSYMQDDVDVNGFRFGDFAYVTDIKTYDDSIFKALEGVDTLVVGAIHTKGSKMHFSIEEALEFSQKVNPKKTVLTHISHEISNEELVKRLPSRCELAYDGMVLSV